MSTESSADLADRTPEPASAEPAGTPRTASANAFVHRHASAVAALCTGAGWALIMLLRLFAGGTIGMGDQGDARRLMCQLGVRSTAPFNGSPTPYLYTTWVKHAWYGETCTADGAGGGFRSSELWLLSMAKHLTPVLGLPGALDLRALGVICALLVGVIVGALVRVLPGPLLLRIGLASAVGLLAADSAVSQFLISPYSEPAELLGVLALCPALVALWRRGHTTWPSLAAVGFLGAVTIGAKSQALALLPALVLALVWLPHGTKRAPVPDQASETGWRASAGRGLLWTVSRGPGLLVAGLLTLGSAYFVATAPVGLAEQNVYASVFGQILPHSSDRAADLRALGASPTVADASGTNPESANAVTTRLEYLRFRKDVTETNIIKFYLKHPGQLVSAGTDGLHGVAHWRQDYLGSYPPHAAAPGTIEHRIGVYGAIMKDRPRILYFLLWAATLYVGIRTVRHRNLAPQAQAIGRLAVVTSISAFLSFWIVMVSVGYPDMFRHMILTNVLLALGLPLMIGCGAVRLLHARQEEAAKSTERAPA
ncbi:MAG: hypothetical protein ABI775_01730 [Pseudonocardiales bacterium]